MTSQPIDLYKAFDQHFFRPSKREESAAEYRAFLEQWEERINGILPNPAATVDDLSVYAELEKLEQWEHKHMSMIRKPVEGLKITIDDILRKTNVSLEGRQRAYVAGRAELHLARLVFPEQYANNWNVYYGITERPSNQHCEEFARDLLHYFGTIPKQTKKKFLEVDDADRFREVVSSEGDAVFLFWTLAPYVHLNLKERSLSAEESAKKIVQWAQTAHRERRDWDVRPELAHTHLVMAYVGQSVLGYDERMPTHLRARLLGRSIANELVRK